MQSGLEDLWAKIDDRQKGLLSAHAAFMQQVAKAASRGFDRVFGHELISARCLGVSISYSIASYAVIGFVSNLKYLLSGGSPFKELWESWGSDMVATGCFAAGYLFIGSIPLIFKNFRFTKTWLFLILASFPFLWQAVGDEPSWTLKKILTDFVPWGFLAMAGCFGCDLLFIAATRRTLRWAGEMKQSYKIAVVILLNLLLGVILMAAPFFEAFSYLIDGIFSVHAAVMDKTATVVLVVAGSNTIDFLAASVFLLLAAALLIHRALWPLLNRSVFRLQEIGTKGRRAILISLGAAFLGAGMGANVAEWAKKAAEHWMG
jgi:hypothetical protein